MLLTGVLCGSLLAGRAYSETAAGGGSACTSCWFALDSRPDAHQAVPTDVNANELALVFRARGRRPGRRQRPAPRLESLPWGEARHGQNSETIAVPRQVNAGQGRGQAG